MRGWRKIFAKPPTNGDDVNAKRRALPAPDEQVVVLTQELVENTITASRENERRRIVQPFHQTNDDLLRRMLNALQPDSYVRPHRHRAPTELEAWVVLRGAAVLVLFDDAGAWQESIRLRGGSESFGVDFRADVYHSVVVVVPDTVLYEVKLGPYEPLGDKELAPWAPAEDSPEASAYLEELRALAKRPPRR